VLRRKRFFIFCPFFAMKLILKSFWNFTWNYRIPSFILLFVWNIYVLRFWSLVSVIWSWSMLFSKYLIDFFAVKFFLQTHLAMLIYAKVRLNFGSKLSDY
jgi:hypothetical protein